MIKKYNIYVLFFIVTSHLNFKLCTSIIDSQEIHQPKIDEQKDFIQQELIEHFTISLFILARVYSASYSNIKLSTFVNNYYQKFFPKNQSIIFTDIQELITQFNQSKKLIENNEKDILSKTDWKQYIISQNILMINFLKDKPYDDNDKGNLENCSSTLEQKNEFLSKKNLSSTTDIYFKTIIICIIVIGSLGLLYQFLHKKPVKDESQDSKKEEPINPLPTTNLSNENIQKLIQQHNQQNNSSIIGR